VKKFASIGISILAFAGILFLTGDPASEALPDRLTVNVNPVPYPTRFELFYDTGLGLYSHPSSVCNATGADRSVVFPISPDTLKDLRLDPGNWAIEINIESMDYGDYRWSAADILRDFKPAHDIVDYELRNGAVHLKSTGEDPQLKFAGDFGHIYRSLAEAIAMRRRLDTIFHFVIALLVSCAIFLFLSRVESGRTEVSERVAGPLTRGSVSAVALSGMFLVMLWLPLVSAKLQLGPGYLLLGRGPGHDAPPFELSKIGEFPGRYESYFNDTFGFRKLLIRLNNLWQVGLFGYSPDPKVIVGKKGWLFYNSDEVDIGDGITIRDYRGLAPFTEPDLRLIQSTLEWRQKELAARGIAYVVAIAPNKNSVYDEYLPDYITRVHDTTRLDQVISWLGTHSQFRLLDLRGVLIRGKSLYPTYYKTNSHWNTYGAFIAYRDIMMRLGEQIPGVSPLSLNAFSVDEEPIVGGDIAAMLALQDAMPDTEVRFTARGAIRQKSLGKLVFLRDSYGKWLDWLFEQHFDPVVEIQQDHYFDMERIKGEHPRVVVHLLAERYLDKLE
jgi:hypothetical protein